MVTPPLSSGLGQHEGNGQIVSDLVIVERIAHQGADIALLTLNRPAQQNPVDKDTIEALATELGVLTAPGGPNAIVLTGQGKAFSSGGDLKGYQSLYRDAAAFRGFQDHFEAVCKMLERCAAVTIAMVNGTCVAGGTELALACDLITISQTARIGDGHLKFGQLPGAGGSQRLVRAVGVAQAKQWLLTAQLYDAQDAHRTGLTTLLAAPDELRQRTFDLAAQVAELTPFGRATMKRLISIAQESPLDQGLAQELDIVHEYATTSHDATEGLAAFAERRPPRYLGR